MKCPNGLGIKRTTLYFTDDEGKKYYGCCGTKDRKTHELFDECKGCERYQERVKSNCRVMASTRLKRCVNYTNI